jgi:curved DNA-binding protein
MKYKDYYETLGVPRTADLADIKKAYRKLARTYHPDVSKASDAEARFKDAAEAYATLKDTSKRAAYDELGHPPAGAEFAPPPQWRRDFDADEQIFDDLDLADLLAQLGRKRNGAPAREEPRKGQDLETSITLSLADARRGMTVNISLMEGKNERTLEVAVPPGVRQDQKLRLRGQGGQGYAGGPSGDIYLHITLAPHALFRPDGLDCSRRLNIDPPCRFNIDPGRVAAV